MVRSRWADMLASSLPSIAGPLTEMDDSWNPCPDGGTMVHHDEMHLAVHGALNPVATLPDLQDPIAMTGGHFYLWPALLHKVPATPMYSGLHCLNEVVICQKTTFMPVQGLLIVHPVTGMVCFGMKGPTGLPGR